MFHGWLDSPFVLSRQMALIAAASSNSLTDKERQLALFHGIDKWLWNPFVDAATQLCIERIGGQLDDQDVASLTERLLEGPPPRKAAT